MCTRVDVGLLCAKLSKLSDNLADLSCGSDDLVISDDLVLDLAYLALNPHRHVRDVGVEGVSDSLGSQPGSSRLLSVELGVLASSELSVGLSR